MKNASLMSGLMQGLTASASLYSATRYRRRVVGSDLQRLRGDVLRIGRDFQTVLSREYGKQSIPTQR